MNCDKHELEKVKEFLEFLQGVTPEGLHIRRGRRPKMSRKKAFTVIWYLQEHFRVLSDSIEMCWDCGELFDTYKEGVYWTAKGRNYCGNCCHLVPIGAKV